MTKKLAFVFPGQGSQSVGMLNEFMARFPRVMETFAEASSVLDYDLWQLVQNGPAEMLNQTTYTQPALLAASIAIWQIWQSHRGEKPLLLAGHSLGEYTALVCAKVLDFSVAIKLVAARGKFMQEAVQEGEGAMAAIVGLSDVKVQEICELAAQGEVIAPANYNAIGQVVVAGQVHAVERAILLAQESRAKMAKRLSVSVPSHCALMKPASERLSHYLSEIAFQTPQFPIINNVDVAIKQEPVAIKEALVRQLSNPVRWVEIIQQMAKQGIEIIIECGPGKVLSGLSKRVEPQITTLSIQDPASLENALQCLS